MEMTAIIDPWRALLGVPWLLAGSFIPGWLLLRAVGWRPDPFLAYGLSCVLLYNATLACALVTGRISAPIVTIGLLAFSVVAWWIASPAPVTAPSPSDARSVRRPWHHLATLAIAGFVVVFVWRAFAQPLAGPDTPFRWNLLPQLMATTGRLDYYPPVSAADYRHYFYFDGLPPFVAIQYWWTYETLGTLSAHVTGFVVSAQFLATLYLVGFVITATADRLNAIVIVAALAMTPLLFWALVIGQETGFTALCVAATAAAWMHARKKLSIRSLAVVALATQLGVTTREYGAIFIVVGVLLGHAFGMSFRHLLVYAALAALFGCPWYLYVWQKSGNPLFSLSLGGMFPVPAFVQEYWRAAERDFSPANYSRGELLRNIGVFFSYAPLLWVGIAAAAAAAFSRVWPLIVAFGLCLALWYQSIAFTSGGFGLALRVLTPALVLAALAVGLAGARLKLSNRPWTLGACAAAALVLGVKAADDPWKVHGHIFRIRPWPWTFSPVIDAATRPPAGGFVLTDNPFVHAHLVATTASRQAVPLWAPEFAFIFDDTLTEHVRRRRLQALQVTAVSVPMPGLHANYLWRFRFFSEEIKRWPASTTPPGVAIHLVP